NLHHLQFLFSRSIKVAKHLVLPLLGSNHRKKRRKSRERSSEIVQCELYDEDEEDCC
ncbi:hypothetical protein LINGRAHAP2_LOCUS30782, partial [Linum grandiflorum]